MQNQYAIPNCVYTAIKDAGYECDKSMQATVLDWWAWYTAADSWYDNETVIDGRRYKAKRHTLHPARRVCREWASAILDDDGTRFTVNGSAEGEAQVSNEQQDALDQWVSETRFVPTAQRCLERAFGTGTGALALWFDVKQETVDIRARRYDARMILPLSWDDDGITECAFCTQAQVQGKGRVQQLQMHIIGDDGNYHIITKLFKDDKPVIDDSILDDFNTQTDRPTFAILKPAIDNVYADSTYMGQSVFADAIDGIKGVDNAYDSMEREIDATKVKVFMSDDLFDVRYDESGQPVPVPMSPENMVIRKIATNGSKEMIEVFSPDIRIDPLVTALNIALAELGDLTGFGANYFRFDKDGGMKTAREVSSDNSAFARNIAKHENDLKPQLENLLGCLLDCMAIHNGGTPKGAMVTVDFDDSIISDTEAEKNMFMAEIGAGVRAPWEYRKHFLGEDDTKAQASIAMINGTTGRLIDDTMVGTME